MARSVANMAKEQIHAITSAPTSLSADQSGRAKRYLLSMTLRTVCFLAAVATPSPWRWIFLLGAVTLPYFAVILANAGRENTSKPTIANPSRELPS